MSAQGGVDMDELRELRLRVQGADADRIAIEEQLRQAKVTIRELETDLQAKTREIRDLTIHRDRLLTEKEQVWGSVVAREERPKRLGELPRDQGGDTQC